MKKAYVLKIGEHGFVFSSAKSAMAAYELLDAAEFHGTKSYRSGQTFVEFNEGIDVKTINREELSLVTHEENVRLEAIQAYKSAVNSTYHEGEKKQKNIDRAAQALRELGIDPETITTADEEDD